MNDGNRLNLNPRAVSFFPSGALDHLQTPVVRRGNFLNSRYRCRTVKLIGVASGRSLESFRHASSSVNDLDIIAYVSQSLFNAPFEYHLMTLQGSVHALSSLGKARRNLMYHTYSSLTRVSKIAM